MPIVNIESFLKDLGLEKIISQKIFSAGAPQGNSHTDKFNKILKEVTDIVNSLEASTVDDKDKISGELVDIIQLTRRVVYSAIREAENNKAGTDEEKKEKDILKAQKDFDKAFKKKLQAYLLEAEVNNIVNEAYTEFQIGAGVAEDKIKPIDPGLMKIFVDAAKKTTDEDINLSLDDFSKDEIGDAALDTLISTLTKDGNIKLDDLLPEDIRFTMLVAFKNYVIKAFNDVCIDTDKEKYEQFCNDIFNSAPDVTAKQILSLGTPEIKKGVLVSFLRIILYPLTFVVDYLDKKRIYGLDELRLFKDGKEKPRDEQEAKKFQQERLLDYKSNADSKLELQEVELDKDKLGKQQYAVLDCFEGDDPPNGTLIVFHGKNADIHTKSLIDNYRSIGKGYRVIMMEYPGFGLSKGPLSKENISKVTYKLFEDAKEKNLIKGDVIVMGDEGFGCYYAARFAKKIDEKERGSCKGLLLSELFNSTNSDLSTFGKIASYISDAEHLDTVSVLRSLPSTITPAFLIPGADCLNSIYLSKMQRPLRAVHLQDKEIVPVVNYNEDSEEDISKKEKELNEFKTDLLRSLYEDVKSSEVLVYGKKPFSAFLSASASKVNDQKEQGSGQNID